jgi:Trypsin-like peptidase domain
MNDRQSLFAPRAMLFALMFAGSACAGNVQFPQESPSLSELPEVQLDDEIFNVSNGNKDETDRYASAVLVVASGSSECSGTLIHRRLALTAGHCVCQGREDKDTITLGSSNCEKTASIIAVAYSTSDRRPYFQTYTGTVRVHHDFKAVLQKKKLLVPPDSMVHGAITEAGVRYVTVSTVAESRADLAVISLDENVEDRFPITPIARTSIQAKEPVTVVGYGADTVKSGIVSFTGNEPIRRFGKNVVSRRSGETFLIEAPGPLALPGDSGGPCFRDDAKGISLVGINSRSAPGRKASFTSTNSYLKWLDEELKQADKL